MNGKLTRREVVGGMVGSLAAGLVPQVGQSADEVEGFLDAWQAETDQVHPEQYRKYLKTGENPDGLVSLDRLERGFARVLREISETKVADVPAVWLVYNMGVVVKTSQSLFSIDLVHRRAPELAPKLDFALISHNHGDHYTREFYRAMDGAGKTVVNNFIDNYGAADWRKGGKYWEAGGYVRGTKVFKIRDVEIRTSLTDHNPYLVDYTTAFEIRVGNWRMLHSGDCSNVAKLNPIWGSPDLWVQMPGCGIDNVAGEKKLKPKLTAFGHLWELGHREGRVTADFLRPRLARVRAVGGRVVVPLWGDRIV